MGTQLRLVDAPRKPRRPPRARAVARVGRRAVRWPDWRLDERARRVGREGVARARAALEAGLRKAS